MTKKTSNGILTPKPASQRLSNPLKALAPPLSSIVPKSREEEKFQQDDDDSMEDSDDLDVGGFDGGTIVQRPTKQQRDVLSLDPLPPHHSAAHGASPGPESPNHISHISHEPRLSQTQPQTYENFHPLPMKMRKKFECLLDNPLKIQIGSSDAYQVDYKLPSQVRRMIQEIQTQVMKLNDDSKERSETNRKEIERLKKKLSEYDGKRKRTKSNRPKKRREGKRKGKKGGGGTSNRASEK